MAYKVEVREVSTDFHETGAAGGTRTDVTYELGADFDGTWIPFASVKKERVDLLTAAAAAASSSETGSEGETGGETEAA